MSNRWLVMLAALVLGSTLNAVAEETKTLQLDVAGQPLSSSLRQVAEEFDLTIAFYSDSTEGLQAPELDGIYTPKSALETLLTETNLEYTYISDTSVAVRPRNHEAIEERGDSDPKNLSPAPILMAQNVSNQTPTWTSARNSDGTTSVVTGKVTDARSGANIKGALVQIQETGQSTSTDNLGNFRFVNVPLGKQTLRFSYLGIAPSAATIEVVAGDENSMSIALSDSIEEIVVLGQRSARATSLNLQRTAPNNSEVQTADFHGSPLHAVRLLQNICPAGGADGYHDVLEGCTEICGTGMEGPNKANIFKRTIYQMILKVRMARQHRGTGFVIVLPLPVWDSWQRHLGAPSLSEKAVVKLDDPNDTASTSEEATRAWIVVFDVDHGSREKPQPLRIVKRVATSERALLHYTFIAAADKGIEAGVIERFRQTLSERVLSQWNERD